MKPKSQYKCK